jgi:hypothetical protein
MHKSLALWILAKDKTWSWGELEGLKWLRKGEATNYLGFPFGWAISKEK